MKVHNIKLAIMFVYPVMDGNKTFEFRKNDRDYEVGDFVIFHHPESGKPWDNLRPYEITYVLGPEQFQTIPEGWCIFSIRKLVTI